MDDQGLNGVAAEAEQRKLPWERKYTASTERIIYRGGHHVTICVPIPGRLDGVHWNVDEEGYRQPVGRCSDWGGGCPAARERIAQSAQALDDAKREMFGDDAGVLDDGMGDQ
jgi:hypothetical protein